MPQIPAGWEETTLQLCTLPVQEKISLTQVSEDNYISTENMLPNIWWVVISSGLPNINSITKFQKWDILFSNIRTYFRKLWYATFTGGVSNDVLVFRGNYSKIYSKFLFYRLSDNSFFDYTIKTSKWTKMPRWDKEAIWNFPIHLPPLPEQQAIAAVLSSFDDKIELLRAENQTLEQMGQELFKERFGAPQPPKGEAHFSHPAEESAHSGALGAEGKSPSGVVGAEKKSSSGVLGAEGKSPSGDLGASLPEGWRVGKLGEMGTIICWKTPSKNNWDFFWWNIPFIKIPDMHWNLFILKTEDSLTEEGADSQKNKYISEWAICVSCIATVGLVSLTTKSSQTNQQINSIIPKFDNYREYLYYSLVWMKNELLAIGAWWSATLNINTTIFSNISIIIPDQETLSKFDLVIKPLFNKIRANSKQIQSLSATRDQLLPKLMSGEVRVEF